MSDCIFVALCPHSAVAMPTIPGQSAAGRFPMTATAKTRHVRLIEPQKADDVVANYYDKSWGMVIGINDYLGEHPTLGNTRNDAAAFADLLRTHYKFDQVYTFYNHEATCDTIMDWLRDRLPSPNRQERPSGHLFCGPWYDA